MYREAGFRSGLVYREAGFLGCRLCMSGRFHGLRKLIPSLSAFGVEAAPNILLQIILLSKGKLPEKELKDGDEGRRKNGLPCCFMGRSEKVATSGSR